MSIKKVALTTPGLSLYLESEQGLLFHHASQTLYFLPTLSVAIALSIDEGLSEDECLNELSTECNIPREELHKTYPSIYQKVSRLFSQEDRPLLKDNASYLSGQYQDIRDYKESKYLPKKDSVSFFLVGKAIFSIGTDDREFESHYVALLKPIQVKSEKVDFYIEIKQVNKGSYNVFSNQIAIEQGITFDQIMPVVIDHIQVLAFQFSPYTFCFHGAALQTDDGNLLLPGKSGAGKSTLSGLLASSGNRLYSDEMIVLDKNFNLSTITLPIAIKSGSWHVMSSKYPDIIQAKEWHRLDGRVLKYVWPCTFAESRNLSKQPCLILNPRFCKEMIDPPQRALKLSITETIAMLIEGGYQVGGELTEEGVEHFITFIENAHSYTLSYHTSEQARTELAKLWNSVSV